MNLTKTQTIKSLQMMPLKKFLERYGNEHNIKIIKEILHANAMAVVHKQVA